MKETGNDSHGAAPPSDAKGSQGRPVPPAYADDEDWVEAYGNDIVLPGDLRPEAFHGPIGVFAQQVGGVNTMASPEGLLVTGLTAFASECGNAAWRFWNELHTYPVLFVLFVAGTGEGKGITLRVSRRWLGLVASHDPRRIITDLTSGEGLIRRLADLGSDPDIHDTRALVWQEEFAALLRAKGREGNTLAQVLRRTYNSDLLQRNTVRQDAEVPFPAVSFVAHITPEELRLETSTVDAASGFLNRFLVLPLTAAVVERPPALDQQRYEALARELSGAVAAARGLRGPLPTDESAQALLDNLDRWHMSARQRPGLVGKMCERIRENVGRLAVTYALSRAAGSTTPRVEAGDVLAALAVGDLSERTVIALWTETPARPDEVRVLRRVKLSGGEGVSPRDMLHGLYSASNRWRGRDTIARMLEQHLLRKERSGRGWRLFPGSSGINPTLWRDVAGDAVTAVPRSPNERAASPISPVGRLIGVTQVGDMGEPPSTMGEGTADAPIRRRDDPEPHDDRSEADRPLDPSPTPPRDDVVAGEEQLTWTG